MTPQELQGWLNAGLGVLMLGALFLGFRKVWVWGWQLVQAERDRDDWKAIAQAALALNADLRSEAKDHTTLTPEQADMAMRIIREAGRQRSD